MRPLIRDETARAMYAGGRGNAAARRFSRLWVRGYRWGLFPRRGVTLEVAGRRTGRPSRCPLIAVDLGGEWYLVSMLGEECNWVRNVRAAEGRVRLCRGRRWRDARLSDVPADERPPILKRYLAVAPGGRPHIPVDRHAPTTRYELVAARYPVFRIT
jgi:deazaflavin-dependent oxidoreductase (nitroreductase family)